MKTNIKPMNKNTIVLALTSAFFLSRLSLAFAEAPQATKIGIIQQKGEDEIKLQEKEKKLIKKKKLPAEVEDTRPQETVGQQPGEGRVLINKFTLNGATTFKAEDFFFILSRYKDKYLGVNDFNVIATEIQKFYRSHGFITTYVYIPIQNIVDNTVEIRIVEGVIGTIEVEGAKYFDSEEIRKKFNVREGDTVLYNDLLRDMRHLNVNPDLTVKAVLLPGERKDTTDIVLKVKDENPQHIFFDYNNRGTKYTGKQRFGLGYANNNLLGFGDMLTVRFQKSNEKLIGGSADYNAPINNEGSRAGVYVSYVETDLVREYEVLKANGKSLVGGPYFVHPLLERDNLRANFGTGIDFKKNDNYLLGTETSSDDLTVAKLNLSLSGDDSFGATFINSEADFGIPDFAGSLGKDDPKASRLGAGGDFTKYVVGFGRRMNLPFNSYFSVSGKGQYTADKLVAGEQFYIGGADTVRGYPELEYMGDYGYFLNTEVRTPLFLLPSKMKLRDKLQMVYFFDYGQGYLLDAVVGERNKQSLMSVGWGIRFQPWKNVYFKLDWGFPLHPRPSDNSKSTVHLWAHIDVF